MNGEEMEALEKNQAWISTQNLSRFAGEWLAIHEQAVIAKGEDLKAVMDLVESLKVARNKPLYIRVPEGLITS
jgi:hypothetical protein